MRPPTRPGGPQGSFSPFFHAVAVWVPWLRRFKSCTSDLKRLKAFQERFKTFHVATPLCKHKEGLAGQVTEYPGPLEVLQASLIDPTEPDNIVRNIDDFEKMVQSAGIDLREFTPKRSKSLAHA
eukprot:gene18784-biopygen5642